MIFNLFREEAAAARNERQRLDYLLIVSTPLERFVLLAVAAVLAVFAIWTVFGSVTRSVAFEGVTIEHAHRYEVSALEPGRLVEFLVNPNDRVSIGAPIARQTVPELDREISSLRSQSITLLDQIENIGSGAAVESASDSTRVALLQLEARRAAREMVVSQVDGVVAGFNVSLGDYLHTGKSIALVHAGGGQEQLVVSLVRPEIAKLIEIGMTATVDIELTNGSFHRAEGQVLSITTEPAPYWLAELLDYSSGNHHRLEISISPSPYLDWPDGTRCFIRVVLGSNSPISLSLL